MRPTNIHEFWRALFNAVRRIKYVTRGQERVFLMLLIALSWIISGRCAIKNTEVHYEQRLAEALAAVPTPAPIQTLAYKEEPELVDKASAEAVAKVLYGIRYNDEDELEAVVWCIINRVESTLYPDTVIEVCQQPSQWMGYYDDNPVLDDLYDIAYDVLSEWVTDGHRPFGTEYVFFTWTPDQITFRNKFEETASCKYWRVS